jgi:hypothetical protein
MPVNIAQTFIGIILIIIWIPVIILTELNNKNNNKEYNLLLKYLENTTYTKVDLTFNLPISINYQINTIGLSYTIPDKYLTEGILYVEYDIVSQERDARGNTINNIITDNSRFGDLPKIGEKKMDESNYKYLILQNKVGSDTKTISNTTYNFYFYTIPRNKEIFQVNNLKQYEKELDFPVYEYEFGPEDDIPDIIKKRKLSDSTFQKWAGRIGTFLVLLIGLTSLISPIRSIVQTLQQNRVVSVLLLPLQIIINLYDSISFLASVILTLLMTLLVWAIINKPLISGLLVGMIVGITLFINNNNKS